ncbi:MAG: DUF6364 family protein [Thermoanaerobaculia bacterium]
MLADLKITVDQELIERAEAFSRKTGRSVSELIADYLQKLPEPATEPLRAAPIVKSLRGALRDSGLTEQDYRRYLEEKHR